MHKFADECEAILKAIISGPDEGLTVDEIHDATKLSHAQIVDLIGTYLTKHVRVTTSRVRGIKVTKYATRIS